MENIKFGEDMFYKLTDFGSYKINLKKKVNSENRQKIFDDINTHTTP